MLRSTVKIARFSSDPATRPGYLPGARLEAVANTG
jgi:hypothetical protein